MNPITIIQLARFGDILNALPIAWLYHRDNFSVRWVVHKDFATLVQGLSYIDEVVVWDGANDDVEGAAMAQGDHGPIVCTQVHRMGTSVRREANFCRASWSFCPHYSIEQIKAAPLVLDNRDTEEEADLIDMVRHAAPYYNVLHGGELVLVAPRGKSSVFPEPEILIACVRSIGGLAVIDMAEGHGTTRLQDWLAVYERASCLLAIDSAPLHLANATKTPTVALVNNDPWLASEPRPHHILRLTYAEALAPGGIERIAEAVKGVIE
jgi:hypothetical protein